MLLVLKRKNDFSPGETILDEEIHDGLIREHLPGITQRGIIEFWDERRNNLTTRQRRKRSSVLCTRCTHRSYALPLMHMDAYECRWGHRISRLDHVKGAGHATHRQAEGRATSGPPRRAGRPRPQAR